MICSIKNYCNLFNGGADNMNMRLLKDMLKSIFKTNHSMTMKDILIKKPDKEIKSKEYEL